MDQLGLASAYNIIKNHRGFIDAPRVLPMKIRQVVGT